MTAFVRRLISIVPTLIVLSVVLFALLELAPGDISLVVLSDASTESQKAQIERELGLDQSAPVRYLRYLHGLVRLDFGVSARSGLPVGNEIIKRLPPTASLLGASLALGAGIGSLLGIAAAYRRNTAIDTVISAGVSLLTAAPVFWVALLLIGLVSVRLGWLPVLGAGSISHLILPAFCASLALIPGVTRIVRASLIETIASNHVTAAVARGIGGTAILFRHIGPAAARSVTSYLGIQTVRLITSLSVMETIFGRPGLGSMIIASAFDRDGTVLIGASLVIACITFLVFLLIDALMVVIDPRLR